MKILNLYAGIGGNRKLWGGVEVTAVELNPSVAAAYADLYPNDTVIVGDAHQYLLDHYHEFDFIWTSPPCQSHSIIRFAAAKNYHSPERSEHNFTKPIYPDMKLWQEIVFLQNYCKKDWCVENVIPFYKPLIQPTFSIQRHHFWSNKFILSTFFESDGISNTFNVQEFEKKSGFDLSKYKFEGISKRQVAHNIVEPKLGLYVFQQITGIK